MRKQTLIYWQDGDMYVGRLRERADVFSQGETLEELVENIKEVLLLMEETDFVDVPENWQSKEIVLEA